MTSEQIDALNSEVSQLSAEEIVQWAVARSEGRALVTTNFRPYEAVILHLCTQAQADMPVLWVDHGTNLPETYAFADKTSKLLNLNLQSYLPKQTAAHWLALNGGSIPTPDQVARVEAFSRIMKLEPFQRGMREQAPKVWITALRREQNPNRAANLQLVQWDSNFNTLKVNPLLNWTSTELEAYLVKYSLPNERTYYDPAKGDEKHECGLHAPLTTAS